MTLLGITSIGVIVYNFVECVRGIKHSQTLHTILQKEQYDPYFEDHVYFQNHLLQEILEKDKSV
jgi:hypothetical protein